VVVEGVEFTEAVKTVVVVAAAATVGAVSLGSVRVGHGITVAGERVVGVWAPK